MTKRFSLLDAAKRKHGTPLVVLTCYTAPMARILDPHVDILLVGDSLGMVIYGMKSTLPVTLDMMINHGKAVAAHSAQAMVVVDMPFGSYQQSPQAAFASAARIMADTGAQAVKLEGGVEMAETIRFLVERGIPVMGHVGLKPQHVFALGGYRYQGRSEAEVEAIRRDAQAVQQAGAFALVMEGVEEEAARGITAELQIPTIGIGASPACDGQVLVVDDMLGLIKHAPSFVKRYSELSQTISDAVLTYSSEVRNRSFPDSAHCYPFKK